MPRPLSWKAASCSWYQLHRRVQSGPGQQHLFQHHTIQPPDRLRYLLQEKCTCTVPLPAAATTTTATTAAAAASELDNSAAQLRGACWYTALHCKHTVWLELGETHTRADQLLAQLAD
jgi:hypothetical protein